MNGLIKIENTLLNSITTPCIIIFSKNMIENIDFFANTLNFKTEEIFYPIKVNSDEDLLKIMQKRGVGFEIGAISEAELLHSLQISMKKVLFGNPVKSVDSVKRAYNLGIRRFGADNKNEILKLSQNAPNSDVYFRISIDNSGAEWELTEKFGCSFEEIPELFQLAKEHGLNATGISFHVGWNNRSLITWKRVYESISSNIANLKTKNILLKSINIGGGFPAHSGNQYEQLSEISNLILHHLNEWRNQGIQVIAEPGSFFMANSGVMIVSVIDCIKRRGKNWVYIDSGVFQGFYWILSGLTYSISALNSDCTNYTEMIVCGPTCDTHDVFSYRVSLPETIKPGDKLIIYPAGAYIHSAQNYNGFSYPKQILSH